MKNLHDELKLNKHAFIEASAGTGKTYTIENLIFRMLTTRKKKVNEKPDGMPPYLNLDQIVVLTFTEKAVDEIRTRVRHLISNKLKIAGDKLDTELKKHLEFNLNSFDLACIQTIHGWCQLVLTKYAFENRQNLSPEVVNSQNVIRERLNRERRSTWNKLGDQKLRKFLEFLNKNNKLMENLTRDYSPPPGKSVNGFDEIFPLNQIDRIESVINKAEVNIKTHAYEFLLKAVNDIVQLKELFDEKINSEGNKSVKKDLEKRRNNLHSIELCIKKPKPPEDDELLSILDYCLACYALVPEKIVTNSKYGILMNNCTIKEHPALMEELQAFVSAIDLFRETINCIIKEIGTISITVLKSLDSCLNSLFQSTKELKNQNGWITFDDMIRSVYENVVDDSTGLAELLRDQYQFAIIDEFQDTNNLQWMIFRKLYLYKENKKNTLFLVGDPKQSIYGFQGADINTFLNARKDIEQEGGELHTLEHNFRSSAGMLKAFNSIFGDKAWFDRETEENKTAKDKVFYKDVDFEEGRYLREFYLTSEDVDEYHKCPVIIRDLADIKGADAGRQEYSKWIVSEVQGLMGENGKMPLMEIWTEDGRRALKYSDICILVQKKKESEHVEGYFSKIGIPFTKYKQDGFFQSEECLHFACMLEAIVSPDEPGLLKKALLTRFFGKDETELGDYGSLQPDHAISQLFEKWRAYADDKKWHKLFQSIFKETGILYREGLYPDGQRRVSNYNQVAWHLMTEVTNESSTLSGITGKLRNLIRDEIDPGKDGGLFQKDSDKDAIRIMTMHASKGLEFPVVISMGGMNYYQSKNPFYTTRKEEGGRVFSLKAGSTQTYEHKTREKSQCEEEYRRVFYVALTRAKYKLYLPRFAVNNKPTCSALFLNPALDNAFNNPETSALFHVSKSEGQLPEPTPKKNSVALKEYQARLESVLTGDSPFFDPAYSSDLSTVKRYLEQKSYSGIAHHSTVEINLQGREDPDEVDEELNDSGWEEALSVTNDLPRGKNTGNLLHHVLEEITFEVVDKCNDLRELKSNQTISELIKQWLCRYNMSVDFYESVCSTVWNTLKTEIQDASDNDHRFQLCQVKDLLPEMEFHFCFAGDGTPFPENNVAGYMLGYIDLVFRYRGRYYILDWKSNTLPAYDHSTLIASMQREKYTIQYMIYSLALDRWLKSIDTVYNFEDHFGGVYYIYLRGMQTGTDHGVFKHVPEQEEINSGFIEEMRNIFRDIKGEKVTGTGADQWNH